MLKKKDQKERIRSHEVRLYRHNFNATRLAKLVRWVTRKTWEVPRG